MSSSIDIFCWFADALYRQFAGFLVGSIVSAASLLLAGRRNANSTYLASLPLLLFVFHPPPRASQLHHPPPPPVRVLACAHSLGIL
jgi:hypothetical protein